MQESTEIKKSNSNPKTTKIIILILSVIFVILAVGPIIYLMCSDKVQGTVIGSDSGEPRTISIKYYLSDQRYTVTLRDTGQFGSMKRMGDTTDIYCLKFMPSVANTLTNILSTYTVTVILGLILGLIIFGSIKSRQNDLTVKKKQ